MFLLPSSFISSLAFSRRGLFNGCQNRDFSGNQIIFNNPPVSFSSPSLLKEKLAGILVNENKKMKSFIKKNQDCVIETVTVGQAFSGMRGVRALVCDTSEVPADKGLIIRGKGISSLTNMLPEEVFWLLLTSNLPTNHELKNFQQELKSKEEVPTYVWRIIDSLPENSHPMTLFNTSILGMQGESVFTSKYHEGTLPKSKYWEATYDDAISIIAKIPAIAAYIYRKRFNKGRRIPSSPDCDWAQNFVKMLGLEDPNGEFTKLMRLYMTVHIDHESGNVSSFSAATVNSALSDLYYSISAGLNGLAGPLHGLANQECLGFVLECLQHNKGQVPSEDQIERLAEELLDHGKVIPGYGHAVLRITDPRFMAFYNFGKEYCPEDPVYQTMARIFKVVPKVLQNYSKIKDPWPNMDAASGTLLYHYGLREPSFSTVLFAVSRTMGISAQAIYSRGLDMPIIRPKSLPVKGFEKLVEQQQINNNLKKSRISDSEKKKIDLNLPQNPAIFT